MAVIEKLSGGENFGHYARVLTPEEKQTLSEDTVTVGDFKKSKLEKDAKKNWDLFYKRNADHFFKDRHWLTREFPELLQESSEAKDAEKKRHVVLLEAGCGVGNTVFPLLEENSSLYVYACDFSTKAIEIMKGHSCYDESRCNGFVCDLTSDSLSAHISEGLDLVSLFFVLSAIHPGKMVDVLTNLFRVLKVGGTVLFRDYGLYDHAQLRFARGHKLEENFYVRQDGTRAYYFSEEKLLELATCAGFEVLENRYVQKQTINHKEGISAPRIFLQAKLRKCAPSKMQQDTPPMEL